MRNTPELRTSIEANYSLNLWTAFIIQDGHEVCVIIGSNRETVAAEAHRITEVNQLQAA